MSLYNCACDSALSLYRKEASYQISQVDKGDGVDGLYIETK